MQSFSLIGRIAAVMLLLYAFFIFLSARGELMQTEAALRQDRQSLAAGKKENEELKTMCQKADSRETRERMARERLGLVMPGEKIFYFMSDDAVP